MEDIGFDVISDLNLASNEPFKWTNKVTSLYCIVAGNISSDILKIASVLSHLASLYQGVFYVPGTLEYEETTSISQRIKELSRICEGIPGVCLLYHQVAFINGVAVVGINGWEDHEGFSVYNIHKATARHDDLSYLSKSINKLQKHVDVKNIIVVSNAVPRDDLYFGTKPEIKSLDPTPLVEALETDIERKTTHWVYGSNELSADTYLDTVHYISNPYLRTNPYWAKRISVTL